MNYIGITPLRWGIARLCAGLATNPCALLAVSAQLATFMETLAFGCVQAFKECSFKMPCLRLSGGYTT